MAPSPLLTNVRLALRVVGGVVCAVLAALGIALFANPKKDDLFTFCHWLGEGLVFVMAGLVGMYFAYMAPPMPDSLWASLRAGLGFAIFYFWLGCCVMGEVSSAKGKLWSGLGCTAGFLSWAVAAGNLGVSFFVQKEEPSAAEEKLPLLDPGKTAAPLDEQAESPPGGWNVLAGASKPTGSAQ
mmetsp:Transcript_15105/g.35377  ORF Transcript_15105/g.35377 Transcript_15105/m.35377 type:complete len:183 (-) Transcript_15105:36-584(-)